MPTSAACLRAFIAIELPDALKAQIVRTQRELAALLPPGAVRWTGPEQLHLTLRFLGDIPVADLTQLAVALRRACVGHAPCELVAEGFGAFPGLDHPRVLWLGLGGDAQAVCRLQATIQAETAGWGELEARPFQPHLTLGRVKLLRPDQLWRVGQGIGELAPGRLGPFGVEAVTLVRSELTPAGAHHTTLAKVALE
jgi:2'-5' RNA ligase